MGRPNSITFEVDSIRLKAASGKIKKIYKSKVRPFSRSGGYIPLPTECNKHECFVIIMDKK